jgi:hypothetical protein
MLVLLHGLLAICLCGAFSPLRCWSFRLCLVVSYLRFAATGHMLWLCFLYCLWLLLVDLSYCPLIVGCFLVILELVSLCSVLAYGIVTYD